MNWTLNTKMVRMMKTKFVIPLDAVPQGRPRFYNGHAVDPPASKKFKDDVAQIVAAQKDSDELITSPINVLIEIYRSAKTFGKKNGVTNKRYGDIDNLAKGILDALTGIIWADDRQIFELHVYKKLADEPLIIVKMMHLMSDYKRHERHDNPHYYTADEIKKRKMD